MSSTQSPTYLDNKRGLSADFSFLFLSFFSEPNNKRGSAVFQRYSFKDDFLFTFLYTPFNDFCTVTQKISLPLIRNTIYPNQKQ